MDTTVFKNELFILFKSKLEDFLESKIIDLFDLDPFKDLIYETNAMVNINEGIQIGLKEDIGFILIEIWLKFKKSLNDIIDNNEFDLKHFYDTLFECIKSGFSNAYAKYHDAFELYANVTLSRLLNFIDKYFVNHEIKQENEHTVNLKESFFAAINALMDTNYSWEIRIKVAIETISIGIIKTLQSLSSAYIGAHLNDNQIIYQLVNQVSDILFEKLIQFINDGAIYKLFDRVTELLNRDVEYFRRQAELAENYAAELMSIDLDAFKKQVDEYELLTEILIESKSDLELNQNLKHIVKRLNLNMPWGDDFNGFMCDKSKVMRFE